MQSQFTDKAKTALLLAGRRMRLPRPADVPEA